jgi:IMP cyclohydrolase
MYIGRFLVIAPEFGAYRVSSRSFPDRVVRENEEGGYAVVPEDEYDNPYVAYNCMREAGGATVLGNGTHVDPVTEKVRAGYPARDALVLALLTLDYEKDDYDTPRIAGVVDPDGASYIGTVTRDSVVVESVEEPTMVATYEVQKPEEVEFDVSDAEKAARRAYDMEYEHPVAACAVYGGETAAYNGG